MTGVSPVLATFIILIASIVLGTGVVLYGNSLLMIQDQTVLKISSHNCTELLNDTITYANASKYYSTINNMLKTKKCDFGLQTNTTSLKKTNGDISGTS